MQLARLRVDEIGAELARVATEERVRERTVAPEQSREVQAHQQLRQRVEDAFPRALDHLPRQQAPVGQRELEVARDQDGVQAVAVDDDSDRIHGRYPAARQLAQQPVLALGQRLRDLLERVMRAVVFHEAHDVAPDPAHDLNEPARLPVLERELPGQVEEIRMDSLRDQMDSHASPVAEAGGPRHDGL